MSTTPVLGIPNIAGSQNQPEVTHNEALMMMEALVLGARTIGENTPTTSNAVGHVYIVGTAPTGAWAGKANKLAIWTSGGWRFVPDVDDDGADIPMDEQQAGLMKYVIAEGSVWIWNGIEWAELP